MPRMPTPGSSYPTAESITRARQRLAAEMGRRPRAGAVWIPEGISTPEILSRTENGQPPSRPAYLASGTPYGFSLQQVLDLPEPLQADVMEGWVRANFEPAPAWVQANVDDRTTFHIENRIDMEFHDTRTGGHGPAVRRAAQTLQDYIWFQKHPDPAILRGLALQRLADFKAALQSLPPPIFTSLHNNPPEPVEENPLSPSSVELILAKIDETRVELLATRPSLPIIQQNTAAISDYALGLLAWLAKLGDKGAVAFVEAFGKAAGKSLGSPIGAAAASYILAHAPDVASRALQAVASLQRLWPF